MKYSENISFHFKNNTDPFDSPPVKRDLKSTFKGIVSKDGKWISPIGNWKIEKEDNKFTLHHRHGNKYYSCSVNPVNELANIKILHSCEYMVIVEITDSEGKPTSVDFAICISYTSYIPKVAAS